jgi:hypothetical protein
MTAEYSFTTGLWVHDGPGSWHFVTLPTDLSDEIADLTAGLAGGFGSVRVRAEVGSTRWQTSLFPSTAQRTYVLPVKKAVRVAEGLAGGDPVTVRIRLEDVGR